MFSEGVNDADGSSCTREFTDNVTLVLPPRHNEVLRIPVGEGTIRGQVQVTALRREPLFPTSLGVNKCFWLK